MAVPAPGTTVRGIDNPGRIGTVTNAAPRERPSGIYVQVRWADGITDYLHTDELEAVTEGPELDPYVLAREGRYGRAAELRRSLTFVHLAGRLANLVYAMGITETDFYPHQYRPLLTLLESPVNGLLIADEVGLGKTIEAGLIWTELRARFDFRRLLVVCPAMLREKWRAELRRRFGVDALLVDAATLLDELERPRGYSGDGRAWIISYSAARPLKAWRPAGEGQRPAAPGARWRLADLLDGNRDNEALFDLVVFDEAHYMRNRESSQWKLGDLLRDSTLYQLMLTATPINLRNRDLFNLLNLIDPDHFPTEQSFSLMLTVNQPLIAARDAVLNAQVPAARVVELLEEAHQIRLFWDSTRLEQVLADPPTDARLADRAYRAELADVLERMNLLSHVLTRTRKRDVTTARVLREVKREAVPMKEAERALYDAVTDAVRRYALRRGISDGFLLSMPQRQVSSSPAAIAQAWFGGQAALDELVEDLEPELDDESEEEITGESLREALQAMIPRRVDPVQLASLRDEDSKFERLRDVAGRFLHDHPGEKIVLFTTFRPTARYLVERLNEIGLPALLLLGGMRQPKQEVIDEFQRSRTLRFLISTEVASEGVDLQFCRVLVNYDLPWNPTRIEQRIGRIDRLGQQAELIHIWNLYYENTIDARIVDRLFVRLRIFEEALGEAEAVVGDAVRRLESSLFERPLSPEEEAARIEQTAQTLENLRLQREELERNAAHMMAHGQRVMERIEAARELSRRVTEDDLYVYVKDYLERYAPGHRFAQEGNDRMRVRIQLPNTLAVRLEDYLREHGQQGKTGLASGQLCMCHFLNRISAAAERGVETVHQFHPLIRYITEDLRIREEHFYPLVALRLERAAFAAGTVGDYAFYVQRWAFGGVREEEVLAGAVVDLRNAELLADDAGDLLVQVTRINGQDWLEAKHVIDREQVQAAFDQAEAVLGERYRGALAARRAENADRARFQRQTIKEHLERRMASLQETRAKHLEAGRGSLVAATEGQMRKLESRMALRLEAIAGRENVTADKQFIGAGVIRVE